MKHSFYINNKQAPSGFGIPKKDYSKKTREKSDLLGDKTIANRVSALRTRYKENSDMINKINNITCDLLLNLTIARDLGDCRQEKKLRKEFSNYLLELEKGEI